MAVVHAGTVAVVSRLLFTSISTGSAHLGVITQRSRNNIKKKGGVKSFKPIEKKTTYSSEQKPAEKKKKIFVLFHALFTSIHFLLLPYITFFWSVWNWEAVVVFLNLFSFHCQLLPLFLLSHFLPIFFSPHINSVLLHFSYSFDSSTSLLNIVFPFSPSLSSLPVVSHTLKSLICWAVKT